MEKEKKITSDKRILLDTIKVFYFNNIDIIDRIVEMNYHFQEYSEVTTIHGINYVFASFLSLPDRFTSHN